MTTATPNTHEIEAATRGKSRAELVAILKNKVAQEAVLTASLEQRTAEASHVGHPRMHAADGELHRDRLTQAQLRVEIGYLDQALR